MANQGNGTVRRHQFPPLRKAWQRDDGPTDTASYQQQRMAGFQEGMSDGFAQGLEQGREQGFTEGVEQGKTRGEQQGFEAGRQQAAATFSQAADPLDRLLAELQAALDRLEAQRRTELLQLVEKVTRQVIRCELALQPTQLLVLVEEALGALPEQPTSLKVMMNPEELARIRELDAPRAKAWRLTADPALESGECRIVTDSSEMDIGCHHRLSQCMDALQQNFSEPEAS